MYRRGAVNNETVIRLRDELHHHRLQAASQQCDSVKPNCDRTWRRTTLNCDWWNWKLRDSKTGLEHFQQAKSKIAGISTDLSQQPQIANGDKHRLQNGLLDPRASANATESSASLESQTNQNLRDENLSLRCELCHVGNEIDRLGMELLRSHAESERLDRELREAQDTTNSEADSTFHDPERASAASGEPTLCDSEAEKLEFEWNLAVWKMDELQK